MDETQLLLGVKRGWLLGQPDALYQVNPRMNRVNPLNRLISSWVPKLINISMSQELPASYFPGLGLVSSVQLAPKNSGANLYLGIINSNFINNDA